MNAGCQRLACSAFVHSGFCIDCLRDKGPPRPPTASPQNRFFLRPSRGQSAEPPPTEGPQGWRERGEAPEALLHTRRRGALPRSPLGRPSPPAPRLAAPSAVVITLDPTRERLASGIINAIDVPIQPA